MSLLGSLPWLSAAPLSAANDLTPAGESARAQHDAWTASWAAAPVFAVGPEFGSRTIRQTVRLSAGGNRLRVRFTNENDTQPLVIGTAHVALPGRSPGSIDPATDRILTFKGQCGVTVTAGMPMVSDPLDFKVGPLSSLTISIFIAKATGASTIHPDGHATALITAPGDFTAAPTLSRAAASTSRVFLSEVDVGSASQPAATLVTLGDSITDGAMSTVDRNRRWPDRLAERLARQPQLAHIGIANAGIGGNRILHDVPEVNYGPSVLARLDRDVLSVPGLKWVILIAGINDIGHSTPAHLPDQAVSANEIIAGMREVIRRVSARGARIYGGTLTPTYPGFYTPDGEAKRQAVNQWIRTGNAFDAVIDFDAALRDPMHPSRLRPQYDCGDHLHPNDAGYQRMADAIDLTLLQP